MVYNFSTVQLTTCKISKLPIKSYKICHLLILKLLNLKSIKKLSNLVGDIFG